MRAILAGLPQHPRHCERHPLSGVHVRAHGAQGRRRRQRRAPARGSCSCGGRDDQDPLFLQAKEAQASVLERFLEPCEYENQGERVVRGQRLMQGSSDIFLGWQRVRGEGGLERDFYMRQLRDWKGSLDAEKAVPRGDAAVRAHLRRDAGTRARPLGRPRRDRRVPRQVRRRSTRRSPTSPRRTPIRTTPTTRPSSHAIDSGGRMRPGLACKRHCDRVAPARTGHPRSPIAAQHTARARLAAVRRHRRTSRTPTAASSPRSSPASSDGADGHGRLGQRQLRLPGTAMPRHRQPEPVAPVAARREAGPVRGRRGHLPGARPRPVEHHVRRGRHRRHRDRPADLDRDGRRRAGALPRSTAASAPVVAVIYTHSHVDHFGGVFGVTSAGGCRRRQGADHRARGLRRARGRRRTSTPARRWAVAPGYMYGAALARGPQGQVGAGLGQTTSTRRGRADRADPRHPHDRRDAHRRRRRDRVPDGAGHRGARRRCTSTSRSTGRCAWPRTPPTPCTTC